MKILLACLLGAMMMGSTRAWVVTKEMKKLAAAAAFSAFLGSAPLVTQAVDFSGSYEDPFHVNCKREISVQGKTVTLKGTDGKPNCKPDGTGSKSFELSGTVDGPKIKIDFSPKGGPSDLEGTYVMTPPGIKWSDGNKWNLKQ